MANSNRPEEAVDAYRRALELKPNYTRVIYNLGVACLNMGVYHEAAEHFLNALSLHASEQGRNVTDGDSAAAAKHSSTLWSTLRRVFVSMVSENISRVEPSAEAASLQNRPDLADKAVVGADLNTFRGEFEF